MAGIAEGGMADGGIGLGDVVESMPAGLTEGIGRLSKDAVGQEDTDVGSKMKQ